MKTPHKWIQQEIQSLDPYKDYVRIWKLCSSYGLNDFMQNLIYALTFPNFVVTEWGSQAVWREDGGKVMERSTHRVEQTGTASALWFWYGPHDPRTQKSVDGINKLHAYWAAKMPGLFSYNDDYIYVCAFTAVTMHRLRLKLGAPDISENEKIASHIFWGEMAKLFRAEGGVELHGYPEDFDGCVRFCEAYEHTPRPKPERGNLITSAIFEQFVFRFFPPELQWLGHQLLRSLSLPTTLATQQIEPAFPPAQDILPKLLGLVFWYQETQMDDPPRSYIEERESMSSDDRNEMRNHIRQLDDAFPAHFVPKYKDDPRFAGCPFHAALSMNLAGQHGAIPEPVRASEQQSGLLEAQ